MELELVGHWRIIRGSHRFIGGSLRLVGLLQAISLALTGCAEDVRYNSQEVVECVVLLLGYYKLCA